MISIPFCFSLQIFRGKYIVFLSTRATRHWAIDKVTGGADVEAVLRFKNPLHHLSIPPSLLVRVIVMRAILLLLVVINSGEEHGFR